MCLPSTGHNCLSALFQFSLNIPYCDILGKVVCQNYPKDLLPFGVGVPKFRLLGLQRGNVYPSPGWSVPVRVNQTGIINKLFTGKKQKI